MVDERALEEIKFLDGNLVLLIARIKEFDQKFADLERTRPIGTDRKARRAYARWERKRDLISAKFRVVAAEAEAIKQRMISLGVPVSNG